MNFLRLLNIACYGIFGLVCALGLDLTIRKWQYWVLFAVLVIVDISSWKRAKNEVFLGRTQ